MAAQEAEELLTAAVAAVRWADPEDADMKALEKNNIDNIRSQNAENSGKGQPLVEFRDVCKYYQMGDTTVKAADHISFKIYEGEFVAIVGQSGSGKSTCMNIIGCLDTPTKGLYLLKGRNVGEMNKNELATVRNKQMGFIFQQYNLLPKLDLTENVEVPLMYAGVPKRERRERAHEMLRMVGLGNKLRHKPNELSGGQQQRVSIARALAGDPAVILADEPTGALDSKTGREVMEMLKQLNRDGHTIIFITHDNSLAVQTQRIIRLEDGHVVYDGPSDAPEAVVSPSLAGVRRDGQPNVQADARDTAQASAAQPVTAAVSEEFITEKDERAGEG